MQLERRPMKTRMQDSALNMRESRSTDPVRIPQPFPLSHLALPHATRIEGLRQLSSNSRACGAFEPACNPFHLHIANRPLDSGDPQPIVCRRASDLATCAAFMAKSRVTGVVSVGIIASMIGEFLLPPLLRLSSGVGLLEIRSALSNSKVQHPTWSWRVVPTGKTRPEGKSCS